jgi:hypothetical protein
MKIDSWTEKGIMLFCSGIATLIILEIFDYFFSLKCSYQMKGYAVPFMVFFDAISIALIMFGSFIILKSYLKQHKRKKK